MRMLSLTIIASLFLAVSASAQQSPWALPSAASYLGAGAIFEHSGGGHGGGGHGGGGHGGGGFSHGGWHHHGGGGFNSGNFRGSFYGYNNFGPFAGLNRSGFYRRSNYFAYYPYFYYPYFYGGIPYGSGYGYNGGGGGDAATAILAAQNVSLQQQLDQLKKQQPGNDPDAAKARVNLPIKLRQTPAAKQSRLDRGRQAQVNGAKAFTAGQYRRAAEQFREAVKFDQSDATAYFFMAQALFADRKYTEAISAIKDGLRLSPDWLELDFDMRSIYGEGGDLVSQLGTLSKRLQANPLDREALFLLGFELFVTDQKDKARPILEQVVRLEPDDRHLSPFFEYFEKADEAEGKARPVALKIPDPPKPGVGKKAE